MGRKADLGVAIVLLLIGLGYFLMALQYTVGDISNPGPGLTPRVLGIVFMILSAYLLVAGWIGRPGETRRADAGGEGAPSRKEAVQVTKVAVILFLYVAAMNFLGFALSTFLAILLNSRLMGLEGWRKPVFLGIGTVVLAHLLFVLALDVPLPAGAIWGR